MGSKTDWDKLYSAGRDYTAIDTASLDFVVDKLSVKSGKALDIGCGTGQTCRDLFHRGFKVVGLDISSEAIELAKRSTNYLGRGIDFIQCDVEVEKIPSGIVDLVICKYFFALLSNKKEFAKKTLSVLRPDSLLVIISPALEFLSDDKKHIAMTPRDLCAIVQPYFYEIRYERRGLNDYYFCYP